MSEWSWTSAYIDGGAALVLASVTVNGRVFEPRDQHERELAEKDAEIRRLGGKLTFLEGLRDRHERQIANQADYFTETAREHEALLAEKDAEIAEARRLFERECALRSANMRERDEARAKLAGIEAQREADHIVREQVVGQPELLKAVMLEAIAPGTGQRLAAKDAEIARLAALVGTLMTERDEARAALAKLHKDVAMQGQRLATIVSFVERHLDVIVEWEGATVTFAPKRYTYMVSFCDTTSVTNSHPKP